MSIDGSLSMVYTRTTYEASMPKDKKKVQGGIRPKDKERLINSVLQDKESVPLTKPPSTTPEEGEELRKKKVRF